MRVSDLTPGERLRIGRERRQKTQQQFALRFGVSERRYRRWEHDLEPIPHRITIGRISVAEQIRAARRRIGPTTEVARRFGCSKQWLLYLERTEEPELVVWLKRHGGRRNGR